MPPVTTFHIFLKTHKYFLDLRFESAKYLYFSSKRRFLCYGRDRCALFFDILQLFWKPKPEKHTIQRDSQPAQNIELVCQTFFELFPPCVIFCSRKHTEHGQSFYHQHISGELMQALTKGNCECYTAKEIINFVIPRWVWDIQQRAPTRWASAQ